MGVHSGVVVVGVHCGVEDVVVSPPPLLLPSLNHQVPYSTPSDSAAKKSNKPVEKSRPPHGQPIHSSIIVACVVFPP